MFRLAFTDLKGTRRMLALTGSITILLCFAAVWVHLFPSFNTGSVFSGTLPAVVPGTTILSSLLSGMIPFALLTCWYAGRYFYLKSFTD